MINDPKESDICKAFVRQVKTLKGWNQFKSDFELVHNSNESPQSWGMNTKQASNYNIHQWAMGKLAGIADYTIYYRLPDEDFCRCAVIEFKRYATKADKLGENQAKFYKRTLDLKIPYLLTADVEEAIE